MNQQWTALWDYINNMEKNPIFLILDRIKQPPKSECLIIWNCFQRTMYKDKMALEQFYMAGKGLSVNLK